MLSYKDRSYCSTKQNKCTNVDCNRHLETTDRHFTLDKNTNGESVALCDFSSQCDEYKRKPEECCVCGTTENLHKDGWHGYRCSSSDCVMF